MPYESSNNTARMLGIGALAFLSLVGASARANAQQLVPFEARPFVGAYLPTGDQKDVLKSSVLTGAQLAWNVTKYVSALGTFAWTPSRDRSLTSDAGVDVFQYDVGAEAGMAQRAGGTLLRPFVGAGLGGRAYNYRNRDTNAQYDFAGYGALGAQWQLGMLGVRLEARDYGSRFKGLSGEYADRVTRNDVTVATALAVRF